MASNMQALSSLQAAFDAPLQSFISQGVQGVSTFVVPVLSAGFTVYVVVFGLGIATGRIAHPTSEFLWRALKLGLILFLVRNVSNYQTFVTTVAYTTLPNALASAVGGGTGSAPTAGMWDGLIVSAENMKNAMIVASGTGLSAIGANFVAAVAGVIVVICTGFLAACGFVVGLYANMALALVLALGPVFVGCALFDSTRPFTEKWIGTVVNYIILKVLVVAVSALLIQTYAALLLGAKAGSYGDMLTVVGGVVAYSFCSIYLFYELPNIASGLAGGASLSAGMMISNPISSALAARRLRAGTPTAPATPPKATS